MTIRRLIPSIDYNFFQVLNFSELKSNMSAISIVVVCEYIVDICCCLFNELGFLSEAVLFAAVLVVLSNVCSIEFSR